MTGSTPMLDTTPNTIEIAKLIVAGTPESEIIMRVMRGFPDLTIADLSQAHQRKRDLRRS
jgi:hypothetical protein